MVAQEAAVSEVVIVRCEGYDPAKVRKAIKKGIDLLGGISRFVKKGEKLLLKPNLLSADPPEKCVTTHPAVFKAAAEIFLEAGGDLSFGDSPAYNSPATAARRSGLMEAAENLNVPLDDFKGAMDVHFEEGKQNKKFILAAALQNKDGIISLSKMKTHGFEKFTGAVKNLNNILPVVSHAIYALFFLFANIFLYKNSVTTSTLSARILNTFKADSLSGEFSISPNSKSVKTIPGDNLPTITPVSLKAFAKDLVKYLTILLVIP